MTFMMAAVRLALPVMLGCLIGDSAFADVKTATPDRLEFQFSAEVALPKDRLWARVVKPGSWWSDHHTYSGKASSMTLSEKAGGCWCEVWPGGQVEHGRVVFLMPGSQLRIETALGPFQEMAVVGVLAISLAPGADAQHTRLEMTYKLSGSPTLKLDAMSAVVDGVLAEAFANLSKAA